jgi:chromosome segregation protein
MRIKRLEIAGFKSFMDKTVFAFDDGVTGVVGPNGCGKSNVVDAIRWVMGEQSAKNLRGRGMEDVIFSGSEAHAPLGMAEVTLTFGIGDGDVMPPSLAGLPEVSVTRRLFRSGDSEYQINKTASRLLDITELFLGTGVGTKAYSIIEQGRVGQIVSSRPEDRRAFIEEAAGVTRYKARRKAAERKMEHTQNNLLRVNDVVVELEKQLDALDRQARKAEKYKKLRAQARDIELHQASHRYLEQLAMRTVLAAQLSQLTQEEKDGIAKVAAMDAEISTARDALEHDSEALEALTAQAAELKGEVQLDLQSERHLTLDRAATIERAEKARLEHTELEARAAQVLEESAARLKEHHDFVSAGREDEVARDVARAELDRVQRLSTEISERLDRERAELVDVAAKLADQEAKKEGLLSKQGELEALTARLNGELEVLRAEEHELEAARAQVMGQVGQSRQTAQELAQRRGEEESQLEVTRSAFAENEIQVICLREELADKRSRLASLEELKRNYEGYERGVRAVMARAGDEPAKLGIVGLVSDLLSTAPEYERAVEAALGARLQHVVVESSDRAVELVRLLKESVEGRGTFLPLPKEPPPFLARNAPEGSLGFAASLVAGKDPQAASLIDALFEGVVFAADLGTAEALHRAEPGFTVVTLEGEVFQPNGAVTGGVLEGPAVGALQKQREIESLKSDVKGVEERYNEVVTRHYSLQKQMGHAEGVLKGLAKNQHAEELALATWEKDLHQAASNLSRVKSRESQLDKEVRDVGETQAGLQRSLEAFKGELAHAQTDRLARDERVRLLAGELETLKGKTQHFTQALSEVQVRAAEGAEKARAAREAADRLKEQGDDARVRAERAEVEAREGNDRAYALEAQLKDLGAARVAKEERLGALETELTGRHAAHAEQSRAVHAQDAHLKELRAHVDSLVHGLSQASIKDREITLEIDHLQAMVAERHGATLAEALHEHHWKKPVTPEQEKLLKELRTQLERMGEVNLTAIEEHHELRTRFEFLSKQQKDLQSSLKQLEDAIKKIDATSKERFRQTFEIVNEKFQQIYPRLFGGGRASLALTQDVVGQEAGVEIFAQPPGKKLQSVSLLSGGEKALTAVALIFAIFLIKPTPFCLLDEVDAPLDEANVGRYNDMVKEMSSQSQFILITHNKRTMEIVDTLYGVTMEEPGVSKLVSVKLHGEPANTDQVKVA